MQRWFCADPARRYNVDDEDGPEHGGDVFLGHRIVGEHPERPERLEATEAAIDRSEPGPVGFAGFLRVEPQRKSTCGFTRHRTWRICVSGWATFSPKAKAGSIPIPTTGRGRTARRCREKKKKCLQERLATCWAIAVARETTALCRWFVRWDTTPGKSGDGLLLAQQSSDRGSGGAGNEATGGDRRL